MNSQNMPSGSSCVATLQPYEHFPPLKRQKGAKYQITPGNFVDVDFDKCLTLNLIETNLDIF